MRKIVGIDFGDTIGVAIAVDKFALPSFITRSMQELAQKLLARKIDFLVIGWPLLLDGTPGQQCEIVNKMLQELLKMIGSVDYHLQDERFSSRFTASSNKKRCEERHAQSAAWILQLFLDSDKANLNS